MQNVAHAYLQTQVGTTGQGEIVVMLFDGALRFLAQARDKMQAKDYAGKGQLISRALDIVNELDSSLNMEVGGELAKNLHQLYFLCTTRLLQANLKLDMDKLDSVVEILSGLRGAFAQVLATPEAQAACAQLGAKRNAQAVSTSRSVATAPTTPVFAPKSAVAGLYLQQDAQRRITPPLRRRPLPGLPRTPRRRPPLRLSPPRRLRPRRKRPFLRLRPSRLPEPPDSRANVFPCTAKPFRRADLYSAVRRSVPRARQVPRRSLPGGAYRARC